ncbi:glycosyl hydrolase [Clostridium chromiireducens]|uniref:glycosyl hydrolase n=1 Tax=Clostridium chromiireducens TaxID=225345 RepID=UPI003AF559AA
MLKKILSLTLSLTLAIGLTVLMPLKKANAATPVNSGASVQAKNVLNYISSLSGKSIISGEHDKAGDPTATFNAAYNVTGQYPGIWGNDFGFASSGLDTMNNRQGIVDMAKAKWVANSLVELHWHMVRPDLAEPNVFEGGVKDCPLTAQQWIDITTPGTSLYNAFINRIESITWALKQLRDAGVPVLWRPFHEMNGNWFWWGGNSTYSKKLYQIMYNQYVNVDGLNNLIWVWNVDRPSNGNPSIYYPGSNYVDILSMDIYDNDYNNSYYNTMVSLAAGKPIAMGEVGNLPTPAITAAQPKWTYFMCWPEFLQGNNTNTQIQTLYWDYRTITQNEMPDLKSAAAPNLAYNKTAYASSTDSGGNVVANAFDGNGNTRWSSAYFDPQWIYVDLGSVQSVSKVILKWESAYAKQYQIQVSTDGNSWTTVYTNSANTGGDNTITFNSVNARYVKMYGYERATTYGYSLYEFEVYK